MATPLDAACEYVRRGWSPVPIPFKAKHPTVKKWQDLRLTDADLLRKFRGVCNIGVLLGEPSMWLIDVDLDHPLAVELADLFLPPTGAEFGRAGKPRSHRLYIVTAPVETLKRQTEDRKMIVELRSSGCQTVFPGSVHPDGDSIEWSADGEPVEIAPGLLLAAVNALADEVVRRLKPHIEQVPAVDPEVEVAVDRARKYVAQIPPAVSGQGGHNVTFHAACSLVQGFALDRDAALSLLSEWNQSCEPPWSDDQLAHKVDDALKLAGGERGYLLNGHRNVPTASTKVTTSRDDDLDGGGPGDPWPEPLDPAAFHGLAGEVVRAIEPHSEADCVALLTHLLVGFGNIVGAGAYFCVEGDRHPAKLFACLVGASSKGRKDTARGQALRVLGGADADWFDSRVMSGLSSGEGLIWAVRDPITKHEPVREKRQIISYQEVEVDPGVSDKRLLVNESELGSVLRVLRRESNTLSPVVRDAWDKDRLQTMTKNSPAVSTRCHVSIVGHITRDELRRHLTETDMANGFANRFLWLCVRRSKCLPEGGELHRVDFEPMISRLRDAVDFARSAGEVKRDDDARIIWREVYSSLSEGRPGLLGAVTSRAEAQVVRLSLAYALLDRSGAIRAEHVTAALALWEYAEQSARYIFGSALGDPTADEILRLLRSRPDGVTRNEMRDHFGRNVRANEIARALVALSDAGLARKEPRTDTGGRPAEVWYTVRH